MKTLFFSIFICSFISAQTLEDEVSKKSCECINLKLAETGSITRNEINKCISTSGDAILKTKDQSEVRKITQNMEQFVERLKIVYQKVSKNCLPKDNERH